MNNLKILALLLLAFIIIGCTGPSKGPVAYQKISEKFMPEKLSRTLYDDDVSSESTSMGEDGDDTYAIIFAGKGETIEILSVVMIDKVDGIKVTYRKKQSDENQKLTPTILKFKGCHNSVIFNKIQ